MRRYIERLFTSSTWSYKRNQNLKTNLNLIKAHCHTCSYLLPLYRKLPQSVPVGPPMILFFLMLNESWVNEIATCHSDLDGSLCGLIPSCPVVVTVFKINLNPKTNPNPYHNP